MALTDKLTAIGNAIRAKTGGTDLIPLADMPTVIASIPSGGGAYDITATDNGDGTQSLAIADAAGGGGQTYTVTMPGKFTQEASAGEFVTYFDTDYSVTTTGIKTATTNQAVPYRSTFAVRTFVMPAEDVVISFE